MNPHRGDKSNELLAWMQIWDELRHLTPSDAAGDQMVRGPPGAPAQPGGAGIRAENKHQRDSMLARRGSVKTGVFLHSKVPRGSTDTVGWVGCSTNAQYSRWK